MKAKIITFAAILIFLCGRGVSAEEMLTLSADYATYYLPSDSTAYVEFYYSLYRHQLGFVGSEDNDNLYAGVLVTAKVTDQSGEEAGQASSYLLTQVDNGTEQQRIDIRLFDYLPMKISPGYYRVELSAIDDVSKATGQITLLMTVPDYSRERLVSSDLELAYKIQPAADTASEAVNPRLVKEGFLVVPNPSGVYQVDVDSVLYVYSELYGLAAANSADSGFTYTYMIKDSLGNTIHNFGKRKSIKPGGSAVLANVLDLATVKPGRYFLFLEANDPETGQSAIATKRFSFLGPEAIATTLTDEDVQLMVDIAWYHLSEAEKMQIGGLTHAGKANLIRQFWRDQDNDPSNPENPVYDEAVRRFLYANENFSTRSSQNDGWRTDRGRVYITYGPFDEWMEEVMTGKSYPYVKWEYHQVEGGCIFVFVNDFVAGAVDYRLVHSTHPREKYDPKWKDILEDEDTQDDDWKDAGDKEF